MNVINKVLIPCCRFLPDKEKPNARIFGKKIKFIFNTVIWYIEGIKGLFYNCEISVNNNLFDNKIIKEK